VARPSTCTIREQSAEKFEGCILCKLKAKALKQTPGGTIAPSLPSTVNVAPQHSSDVKAKLCWQQLTLASKPTPMKGARLQLTGRQLRVDTNLLRRA